MFGEHTEIVTSYEYNGQAAYHEHVLYHLNPLHTIFVRIQEVPSKLGGLTLVLHCTFGFPEEALHRTEENPLQMLKTLPMTCICSM